MDRKRSTNSREFPIEQDERTNAMTAIVHMLLNWLPQGEDFRSNTAVVVCCYRPRIFDVVLLVLNSRW